MSRVLLDCLGILNRKDKKTYLFCLAVQVFLSVLDLIGVAVLGLVGAIAIRGVQSQKPGDRASKVLEMLGLDGLNIQQQVAILGIASAIFLVGRTLFSMLMSRKILHFLSSRSATISSSILSKILSNENSTLVNENAVKLQFILGPGVSAIAVGILGTFATIVGDFSVLIVITIGVIVVNPEIAILSVVIFGGVGLVLYYKLHLRAENIGNGFARLSMQADQDIAEIIYGNREIYVRNRRHYYLQQLTKKKEEIAYFYAENSFIPNIGKYVIEITVILGAVLVSALEFLRQDSSHAVAGLAVFLIAGARIAPALLRLQQGFIAIKSHLGIARTTLETHERVKDLPGLATPISETNYSHEGFTPVIEISELTFRHSNESTFELNVPYLHIKPGERIAIVGPSGSGKSTLVDLLLGLHSPEVGEIKISNFNPETAVSKWPGAIGYVPQDIYTSERSILENIAFGFDAKDIDVNRATESLREAQLQEFVEALPEGIKTKVGERGSRLSGGQRQRLGIARSLYTKPKLLILDEATSALDGIIENEVSEAINNLRNGITIVLIAHRLSTVRMADRIIYMEKGRIRAIGTFSELREVVPDFDKQAKLSGF